MAKSLKDIALLFNDCISKKDIVGLADLMTDDHRFIDSSEHCVFGKQANIESWKFFFEMFPDYKNIFETVTETNSTVTMHGYVECSNKIFNNTKYIWASEIENEKVKEWRVYIDNKSLNNKI